MRLGAKELKVVSMVSMGGCGWMRLVGSPQEPWKNGWQAKAPAPQNASRCPPKLDASVCQPGDLSDFPTSSQLARERAHHGPLAIEARGAIPREPFDPFENRSGIEMGDRKS